MSARRWGQWSLDEVNMYLVHDAKAFTIILADCQSSTAVLDYIAQIASKQHVSSDDVGDLVRALNELLYLQANYCSWGVSGGPGKHVQDPKELIRRTLAERDWEAANAHRWTDDSSFGQVVDIGKYLETHAEFLGGEDPS